MLHDLTITSRGTVLDGRTFGDVGPYEQCFGSAQFRLDPAHAANAGIVDLALALTNADGHVECRADIWLLMPADASRGNGSLFYHVVNRGRNGMLSTFQRATGSNTPSEEAHFGDGLLMEHGFMLAAVGWQADVPRHAEADDERDLLTLEAPVAEGVTGLVGCEIVVDASTDLHSLGSRYHHPYEWSTDHVDEAVLTVRDEPEGAAETLPRGTWTFDRLADGQPAIRYAAGFVPGRIYNLVYTGRDPLVMGAGMATTRDFVSFLKYGSQSQANPLARRCNRALAFGSSQSGRFLRHMMVQGFNADEAGRQVFDGLFVSVGGGGQGSFNHRFAQPSRHSSAHVDVRYPTEQFPFADVPLHDPLSGETAGLLDRCQAQGTTPRIFYCNTSTEYWNRSASLIHTDVTGQQDVRPHPDARIYLFSGTQHGPGELPSSAQTTPGAPPPANPVDFHLAYRALALALDDWVRQGTEPPPSAYPTIADATLVPLERIAWPMPNGVQLPTHPRRARRLDWGDRWVDGIIDREPPAQGQLFTVLFPQVDDDGNERAGIRMPEVTVPLGTFTGWRYRTEEMGATWALAGLAGMWLPLRGTQPPDTQDPRPCVAARYAHRDEYLKRCGDAARDLVHRRLLLTRDTTLVEQRAGAMYDLIAG